MKVTQTGASTEMAYGTTNSLPAPLKVLFLVEGHTDIRFVLGLNAICDLTLAISARTYAASGLKQRIIESGTELKVHELSGGRMGFQFTSLNYLLKNAKRFDVLLAQEVTRGALSANLAGRLRGVPSYNYMGIAPVEYFACRWERRAIPYWKHLLGTATIKTLLTINGRLATGWLAMGPYLRDIGRTYCRNSIVGGYYGVDSNIFRPATPDERREIRLRRGLPLDAFLIFFSSRISHEKDPETVLKATALARERGLNAIVLNLGGGFRDFLSLAKSLNLGNVDEWVIGGPAAHPIKDVADYFRCSDVMALASLAEGAAFSTLEALSCATPVVATAVGGMAVQLAGRARLVPRGDPSAMADEFLNISGDPLSARQQASNAREQYIIPTWEKEKVFRDLLEVLRI